MTELTSFDALYGDGDARKPDPAQATGGISALPSFDAQYGEPAASDPPPAPEGLDWADIGKGAAGGLGRGVAGAVGLPGTIGDVTRAGLRYAGVPDSGLDVAAGVLRHTPLLRAFTGPNAGQVQQALETYTGKLYEPKTIPGQYASTIGEFAPAALIPGGGGLAARALNTVVPAIASETAGQLTKGEPAEPYARAAGGLLGGFAGAKAITPTIPPGAAHAAAVAELTNAGVPLTAGVRTGSRPLQWMESAAADMPFSAPAAQRLADRTAAGYGQAITNRIFDRGELTRRGIPEEASLPNIDVAAAGQQSLRDAYDRITQNNVMRADPQLMRDQQATLTAYERGALPSQRAGGARDLAAIHDDILDHLIANNGSMAGDIYQLTRSRLGTLGDAVRASDPHLAAGFRDTQAALDRAMARSLSPQDAAALANTNLRYALMKQTENAVARAGDRLSPAGVAQAVRAGRAGQYNAGAGALDPLVRAGATALKTLPNSGTAARMAAQQLFNLPQLVHAAGTSAAGGAMGSLFGPAGIALGIAMPHIAARAVVSQPVQRYFANQAVPQNMRDILAQTIAQQATAAPGSFTNNRNDRAAYDRRRASALRQSGLQ